MTADDLPKVCVLMATYNGQPWVKEQLQSILVAENVQVEVYVADDGSSDGTLAYLRSKENSQVHVVYTDKCGGASKNFYRLLAGVNFKKFDYVALADQDDVWDKDKLVRAVTVIRESKVDCYSANVRAFWEDGRQVVSRKSHRQRKFDYCYEAAGPGCTYVFSVEYAISLAEVIRKKVIGTPAETVLHDWFAYAYARTRGWRWYIDDNAVLAYRQHDANVVGMNVGLNAAKERCLRVVGGWYAQQIRSLVCALQLTGDYTTALTTPNLTRVLWSFFRGRELRRDWLESVALRFFIVLSYARTLCGYRE